MLVEDNSINQKLAVRLLKKFGYEVDVAANGREALSILDHHSHSYEAILMDCQMPEMDGFEATREIRRREAEAQVSQERAQCETGKEGAQGTPTTRPPTTVRIPIIALTANVIQGDREQCLAAGMDDYLTKPINPTALKTTLSKWLSRVSTSESD
jgi:CheY-like chemotaxis protein